MEGEGRGEGERKEGAKNKNKVGSRKILFESTLVAIGSFLFRERQTERERGGSNE